MEGNNNVGISQDGIEQFLDLIKNKGISAVQSLYDQQDLGKVRISGEILLG
ncbi:hypothetical protein [Aeromonas caviae]|uniref:hypothetical protein n=1 Tax=Aeromonas caviae TaxID=648 RepID=UPI0023AB1032|nr:hypothetical protein [Aeromonas caviae]WEE23921.1 hypothetical protein PY772_10985 [Aeromonas caviae]